MNQTNIRQIPIDYLRPNPWQTRQGAPDPAYIKELALDIAAHGLLQIPIGRMLDPQGERVGDVQIEAHGGALAYLTDNPGAVVQLAFGHNRLAAYRFLFDLRDNSNIPGDWSLMPIDVRALTDEQMASFAWSENEKRRDVTAIERSRAIQQRIDSFKWTNRECAAALGLDHSTVSNMLRLLKLPEDMQQSILDGKISERQAMAILPVFEAPNKNGSSGSYGAGYYFYGPSLDSIQAAALAGESSDSLRSKVDSYFQGRSKDLAQAEFKPDQFFPEGDVIYCALCKTCDRRFANRNRCFDADCFDAKTAFLHREYLKKASAATGYPLVDEMKGGRVSELPYSQDEYDRVVATGCPNLALMYSQSNDTSRRRIDGFPHAVLVCDKRNDSCTCKRGLKSIKDAGSSVEIEPDNPDYEEDLDESEETNDREEDLSEPEPSEIKNTPPKILSAGELEDAARQARRAKLDAAAALDPVKKRLEEHLYQMVESYDAPGVWFAALNGYSWANEKDIEKEKMHRLMAHKAARVIMPTSADSVDALFDLINKKLSGLKLEALERNP